MCQHHVSKLLLSERWKNACLMQSGPNVYVRLWPHRFMGVSGARMQSRDAELIFAYCSLWAALIESRLHNGGKWERWRLFHHSHCYAAFCCQRTSLPSLNYLLLRVRSAELFLRFVYQFNACTRDWWVNSHAGHAVTAWFVNYAWLRNQRAAILQIPGNLINPGFPFVFISKVCSMEIIRGKILHSSLINITNWAW